MCAVWGARRGAGLDLERRGDDMGAWTREVAVEIEPRGYIRAMKSYVKLTDGH